MSEYRKHIGDIFESLYGSDIDEDGERYDNFYDFELLNMEKDYYEYLSSMNLASLYPTIEEVARFIVYTESIHIGNDHMIRNCLDIKKLEKVVKELLE